MLLSASIVNVLLISVSPFVRSVCRGDHIHHSGRRNMQVNSDGLLRKCFDLSSYRTQVLWPVCVRVNKLLGRPARWSFQLVIVSIERAVLSYSEAERT